MTIAPDRKLELEEEDWELLEIYDRKLATDEVKKKKMFICNGRKRKWKFHLNIKI